MIGCSVVRKVGSLDAGFLVRRTTDHAPEIETCLSTGRGNIRTRKAD